MSSIRQTAFSCIAVLSLAACANEQVGSEAYLTDRGSAVKTNVAIQTGARQYLLRLGEEFRASVPYTVNFAFNSAVLEPTERRILDQQAAWITRHPNIRLRIYGHTDLVGSPAYNRQLGLRRAEVVARYLVSRGVSSRQLEAVASFGETRPVIFTSAPERLNRRTVTEVDSYVTPPAQWDFDGKRAEQTYVDYVTDETPSPGADYGGSLDISLSD